MVQNVVEFYQKSGQWRWRVTAANNEIIGASTEGYHNLADAKSNFQALTGRQIVEDSAAGDWGVLGLKGAQA